MTDKPLSSDNSEVVDSRSESESTPISVEQRAKEEMYEALDSAEPIEAENSDEDTLVLSIDYSSSKTYAPIAPQFRGERKIPRLKAVHVLGDLH